MSKKSAVRRWISLRTVYFKPFFCKRAQSLSEMAICGGLLLLVLSYFVNLGIKLTYQQDVQMRAFRLALSEACNEGTYQPDAEATVTLVEDKISPDPRNMVGKGDILTVASQGNVLWGNTLQNGIKAPYSDGDMARLKYIINGEVRDYSVNNINRISNNNYNKLWVEIPEQGIRKEIQWGEPGNELRCYKPTADSPQQARILVSSIDMITEIITNVSLQEDGPLLQIIKLPETLSNGDPVKELDVLNPAGGDLDSNYMNLDYIKEHADRAAPPGPDPGTENLLQGLLPYTQSDLHSAESLLLQEFKPGPAGYESTTQLNRVGTTVTHYIRLNDGARPKTFIYTPPEKVVRPWLWQTKK